MAYRALDILINETPPLLHYRKPLWYLRQAPPAKRVHVPTWNWTNITLDADAAETGARRVTLDVNAAYLSAASTVTIAHGALRNRGALPLPDSRRDLMPGWYLISSHQWQGTHIVSPLGTARLRDQIWVAHPTLELLMELQGRGLWPDISVYDSWTCDERTRLTDWTDRLKADRTPLVERLGYDPDAAPEYKEFKDGVSMAVVIMRGPTSEGKWLSKVYRPDWADAIVAAHAANTWRKVHRGIDAGCWPLSMGAVDEITYTEDTFQRLADMDGSRPFRFDQVGVSLGSVKVKAVTP